MSSPPDAEVYGIHHVYRCYDREGQLLYVGCARDVEDRMYHHMQPCNMGKQPNGTLQRHLARWTSEAFPTKLAARAAERVAIAEGRPLLNKQHNPSRFRRVGVGGPAGGGDSRGYVLVEPVHPLTRWAFPELPILADERQRAG
jgi:hypothetical protein